MKTRMNRQTHPGITYLPIASICNTGLSNSAHSCWKRRFSERGRTQLKWIHLTLDWNCSFLGKGREWRYLSLVAGFPFSTWLDGCYLEALQSGTCRTCGGKSPSLPIARAVMVGGIIEEASVSRNTSPRWTYSMSEEKLPLCQPLRSWGYLLLKHNPAYSVSGTHC